MVKHNNVLQSSHLRKHWQMRVKCYFNQKAHKKLRKQARADKAARLFPRPVGSLRPIVMGQTRRYAHKVRIGKGFSLAELKQAGLTRAFAQTVGISVDHRRHNKSAEGMASNVAKLNEYKSKLILFPKRDGKHKKGEIADSTKEQLSGAAQNNDHALFKLPAVSKRCKAEPITKEMQAFKAFQKLRHERINQYYAGSRKKKAADAERAKK